MNTRLHVIILNEATDAQIDAVHELLKQHATGWWHHFENVWIVGGELNAAQWREVVTPLIDRGRASVLVMPLPDEAVARQNWSYYGIDTDERLAWLSHNLGRSMHSPPRAAAAGDR